jgi:chromosome partitioning protein
MSELENEMAHVISLVSSKGGTGKTTTALNLAVALAELGHRTLLADLDPQGGVALSLAKGDAEWCGLAEYLLGSEPLDKALMQTKLPNLELLPRGRLDPVDICTYEAFLNSSKKIRELVEEASRDRDYLLIDCPSGLGMISRAALACSDFALVPLQAEPMALRSVGQVLRVIDHVRGQENPKLRLLGLLPTMVELHEDTSLGVMSAVWSGFSGVLETCVPRGRVFLKASELGLPVSFLTARPSPEARRFKMLANEIEGLIAATIETGGAADETMPRQLI